MEQIVGFPDVSGSFAGETLFLRGGLSPYVLDSDMPDIVARFPSAKLQTIDGAGHWIHAEATREFIAATRAFFS